MSGAGQVEPKYRPPRRNNAATMKVEEKRLQSLLNFIDTRMQEQRSKLRRQIEDTQQSAEEMEERRHKATLQVLKNYFEVTSGRIRPPTQLAQIHEERMTGVLSEPSLATVPEIDPEVLAKPRSMYDRITRNLDTSKLPLIATKKPGLMSTQSASLPATLPNSTRSDDSRTPRILTSPQVTPSSTPKHSLTPSDSTEDCQWSDVKKPVPLPIDDHRNQVNHTRFHKNSPQQTGYGGRSSPQRQVPRLDLTQRDGKGGANGHYIEGYAQISGHLYQRGSQKPTSTLNIAFDNPEPPTPRLGDMVASQRGLTRHISLKRPSMKSNASVSTLSMSELQPTRKQQAASKLKHALKSNSFRIQR